MNKKLIAVIVAAVIAVAAIIAGIVYVAGGIGGKTPAKDNDSVISSQSGNPDKNNSEDANTGVEISGKDDKVDAKKGKTVSVPVEITKNPGIVGAQLTFTYDTKALTFRGYDNGDILADADLNNKDGQIKYVATADDVNTDSKEKGTLLTLKFEINKDAAAGDYKIEVVKDASSTMFCNTSEQVVVPEISVASVTVK